MKNSELKRLELSYQRHLYHLNASLTLLTIGLLSFLGTFIWNKELIKFGFISTTIIFIIGIFWYKNINKNLKKISDKIKINPVQP